MQKIDKQDDHIFDEFKAKKHLGRKMVLMHLIFYVEHREAERCAILSFIRQTLIFLIDELHKTYNTFIKQFEKKET